METIKKRTAIETFAFDKETRTLLGFNENLAKEDWPKCISFPKLYDGVPVEHIGAWAFRNGLLRSITIPDSVITIGDGAFGNNELVKVTLNEGLTRVDGAAFMMNKITKLDLPASLEYVDKWAFNGNFDLDEVIVRNRFMTYHDTSFIDRNALVKGFKGKDKTKIEITPVRPFNNMRK